MNKAGQILLVLTVFFCLTNPLFAQTESNPGAAVESANPEVLDIAKKYLREKAKLSGTIDIYDVNSKSVRNLRILKYHDEVQEEDDNHIVNVECRDMNGGAIVTLAIIVQDKAGDLAATKMQINKVEERKASEAPEQEKKEFSDSDIQEVMLNYVKQQTEFSGSLMLYDEDNSKLRNLKLIKLNEEVRKLGILRISRAEFQDVESTEVLGIDITAEDKNGKLEIQSLRIREIKK